MSEIQPFVSIQIGNAMPGQTPGSFGVTVNDPQSSTVWSGASPNGTQTLSTIGNNYPSAQTANQSGADLQNITNQFIRVLDQMLQAFKGFLEKLFEKLQLAGNGSGSSSQPTATGSTPATGTSSSPSGSTSTGAASPVTSSPLTSPSTASTTQAPVTPAPATPASTTPVTTTGASTSSTTTQPTTTTSTPAVATPVATPVTTPSSSTPPASTPAPAANCGCPSTSTSAATKKPKLAKTGQFLWKPKADKDGKLVVLLPKRYGQAKSVRVLSPDGKNVLASGRFSGVANGDRAHYRFSQAGESFPNGSIVEVTTRDNKVYHQPISQTNQRFVY